MKKRNWLLLVGTLLLSLSTAHAKQIWRDSYGLNVDFDRGWVEMVHDMGYIDVQACLSIGRDPARSICTLPVRDAFGYTSTFRFSNQAMNAKFALTPYRGAYVELVIIGKKPSDFALTQYAPMVDYYFDQGSSNGLRVDNDANMLTIWVPYYPGRR